MLAVIGGPTDGESKVDVPAGPCGVCRQMIYEFGPDTKIIVASSEDNFYIETISQLFPRGFGPENLVDV